MGGGGGLAFSWGRGTSFNLSICFTLSMILLGVHLGALGEFVGDVPPFPQSIAMSLLRIYMDTKCLFAWLFISVHKLNT